MIKSEALFRAFKEEELTYFTGVPDSTFKDFMCFLEENNGHELVNRIAAIERDAIALAAGYHVATGKIGVVYMQNSGLGNTVNPLTSLTDPKVYNIPMLLMIGYRGQPGIKDEPQHVKMGEVTFELLDTLGIEYMILPKSINEAKRTIQSANALIKTTGKVVALVIEKGTFETYMDKKKDMVACKGTSPRMLSREEAISTIVSVLDKRCYIVSTTGKASRELFEYREKEKQFHGQDFMMVGAMGLASSFGLEIALQHPEKQVVILDGDGALLMSEGALAGIGYYKPRNFLHIVLDNEAYESTGGQPTLSHHTQIESLTIAHGYERAIKVNTAEELQAAISLWQKQFGTTMIVVEVEKGSRKDLGRPTKSPIENKVAFMESIQREEV